ncbi:MAG: glycosyltransferase family 2 protein [Actinomycetota bacterium]|nr:glycosyltransferase family 2 protein [Actinomycetota bacterium]
MTRKIVLLGMMGKMPVPGVLWQTLHYLLGLQQLGFEPWYVEANARTPTMLMRRSTDDGSALAAGLIERVMRSNGLGDRWAYHALHDDGRCYGMSEQALRRLYREAEVVINLHGGTKPRPEFGDRLVYLETDPVRLQVELHDGVAETFEFLSAHSAFFTFAENLGRPGCRLPVCERFDFRPTRQPVVLERWAQPLEARGETFTTVANWHQGWRSVRFGGETYGWSKDEQWGGFLDLPARTGQAFELALSGYRDEHRTALEANGWRVRAALDFGTATNPYRDYIAGSRGEFTVAKDQNVRLRSGWFSDRSATYLAAGRPVVTQDTGFGCALPTGEGLFAVSDVEQAAAAIEAIESDRAHHTRAATEVAREHFAAGRVLGRLLDDLGIAAGAPAGGAVQRGRIPSGDEASNKRKATMKLTSVIIPCYDLGQYLDEAVDSVLAQTHPPDELIVVDDGSKDEHTLEVLNALRGRGIMVFRTSNRGAPSARNYGVERARGEYIVCLDADDMLLPQYLQRTVAAMDASPEAGVVATQLEFFGDVTGTWCPVPYSLPTMLWKNCLPSASLFRRRCWEDAGGYTPELEACHDWDLWLSIVERGWKWQVVEEPLYRYRRRSGSISEHREAHRPRIIAAMMRRHQETYAANSIDAIVELDGKLKETTERLQRFKRDNAKQAARLRALEEAARPPEDEQTEPFRAFIDAHLPDDATALVVSKGDESLLELKGRRTWHFPRRADGRWLGHHPRGDKEAIEMLEELRAAGAEYLCFPPKERWWLHRYDELRKYLSQTYSVLANAEEGIVFDVRQEIRRRSFSVVICTYRRPELVAEAMRSVFAQQYPKDRYELIVVNNDSPDETEKVVLEAARDCPVPFTYLIEKRNGLSYARNTGIAAASNEFVAFLDDDAITCRDWMATFNGVIDEHHALVVGGRVEKAFEEGFEPPSWLEPQYVKHFFGINYRDRGRKEKVFRIRYPLYLTGANLVYARRLFDHFGGFDPRLGRDGKSLLGGEESYLNMVLDKHDIPIYYTDDAWVDHHIQSFRVTKEHLRSKAYWSGVTNAVMHPMFFGFEEVRSRCANNRKEIRRRLREIRQEPRSPETFSRELRLIYNLSFLKKFALRYAEHRLGRHAAQPAQVSWGTEEWIAEARDWPDGVAKYERLRELAAQAGDAGLAAEAEHRLAGRATARGGSLTGAPVQLSRPEYDRLVTRVRERIVSCVPPGATVAIASKGDEALLQLEGRHGRHFPQLRDGTYAGFYPEDDRAAVSHLEELYEGGLTHLVFPSTALWWHTHYPGLRRHLDDRHERVLLDAETCVIYRLAEPAADLTEPGCPPLVAAVNGGSGGTSS